MKWITLWSLLSVLLLCLYAACDGGDSDGDTDADLPESQRQEGVLRLPVRKGSLMNTMNLIVSLLLAGMLSMAAHCRRPSRPERPNESLPAAQGETTPPPSLAGDTDQVGPAIAALDSRILVAWTEASSKGSQVVLEARRDSGENPEWSVHLGANNDARSPTLAASGDVGLVAWIEGSRLLAHIVSGTAPQGEPLELSSGGDSMGPPAALGMSQGDGMRVFVVAWVEGQLVRAVSMSQDGTVSDRVSWIGGNERPTRGLTQERTGPTEWAAPWPIRPLLWRSDRHVSVMWYGNYWRSDDQGGSAYYFHQISFREGEGSAQSLNVLHVGDVQGVVARRQQSLAVVMSHNPNGGPWELFLRDLDADNGPPPFASELAGPLEAAVLPLEQDIVVAWPSPTFHGVVIARVDSRGVVQSIARIAAHIIKGEAEVLLTSWRGEPLLALTEQRGGRSVVRLVRGTEATALPERFGLPVQGKALSFTRNACEDVHIAQAQTGKALLVYQGTKADSDAEVLRGRWFEPAGAVFGDEQELSQGYPRIEGVCTGQVGNAALVSYAGCQDATMCSEAQVFVVSHQQGGPLVRFPVSSVLSDHGSVALATSEERVALVTRKGRNIDVRQAEAQPLASLAQRLSKASAQSLVPNDWNHGYNLSAALTQSGVLVAFDDQASQSEGQSAAAPIIQVALFPFTNVGRVPEGSLQPRRVSSAPETSFGTWGTHRLVSFASGAAIAGLALRGREVDIVLRILDHEGQEVARRVLARNQNPRNLFVWAHGEEVAAAWHDERSNGEYVACVQGSGRFGPVRLDDPALRGFSGAHPVLVPSSEGHWLSFWPDSHEGHYAVYEALVARPQ